MQTIVQESNLRSADPVRGCSGVIQDLENQLMDTAVELEVLRRRLESYRRLRRAFPLQSNDGVQQQGPDGITPPPTANQEWATQPRFSAVQPQPSPAQPQCLALRDAAATASARPRQMAREATAARRLDFSNVRADDERDDPGHM